MIKLTYRFLLIFAMVALAAGAASAKVSFDLVPRQNVVSGDRFQVTFRIAVEDEEINGSLPMPKAPELANCRLLSGPNATTSQQQTTIINGKVSTRAIVDVACIYLAGDPGKVNIPSVSLNIGGKSYKSKEGSFQILPADAASKARNSAAQSYPGQQASSASSVMAGEEFFVRVIFSKSEVYEQEGVIAITKLYRPASHKFSIGLEAVPKTPVYEGFLSEDLDGNPEGQIENYKGKNYITFELSRVLLFPQKSGELKVQSGTYTLNIREQVGTISMHGFPTARYEDYTYTTPLATGTIHVKALPEPRPADFSGAVGNYTVSSSLSPDQLRTNESANYSITFKGTGNVKYLTVPTLEFPPTFDKYTAKTDVNARVSGQAYTGTYTITYPIVPQEVGNFEIPLRTFSFFNLSSGKYQQISVEGYDVHVDRGSAVVSTVDQKAVDTEMHDILHIHTLPSQIQTQSSPVFFQAWYWILWAVTALALIIAIVAYRRYVRLESDAAGRKVARANRVASRRFKAAATFMKKHENEKFYEELARALKGYLGDKLGIAPSQLISSTIAERLQNVGVDQDCIDSTLGVLDQCEMARFTPSASDSAMHELYNQASSAVKTIEDAKKK